MCQSTPSCFPAFVVGKVCWIKPRAKARDIGERQCVRVTEAPYVDDRDRIVARVEPVDVTERHGKVIKIATKGDAFLVSAHRLRQHARGRVFYRNG